MHRIEDILRQLNTVSAKIQPELASHLEQIQQRLDRAHQAMEQRPYHANATQPVVAQVALAAAGTTTIGGPRTTRPTGVPRSGESFVTIPSFGATTDVSRAPRDEVAISLWVDSPDEPSVSETNTRTSSAAVAEGVTQAHEPTTPHFVLRQNQPTAARSKPIPSVETPTRSIGANDDTAADVSIVPLKTQVPEPDISVGLPLFESLWFRQAAPNAYTTRLVDRLLQKVPHTVPAVMHFCQDQRSEASSSLVCTQMAWELSRRGLGQVLLIDADYGHRDISRQLGNVYLTGLSEAINLDHPLEVLVRPTGVENLSWLPSGAGDISFRRVAGGRWAEISLQLRRRYQWVCVHAGAAQDRVTATWGRFCDYTYLITNMEDDLGPTTQQVVDLLRATECRVSGLITID
ncbi:MAG: hypothetical protein JNL67_00310 [Planctomycetaceae bacterium]|nr:hypothetical protein [Planctomycetaceae bacterium]